MIKRDTMIRVRITVEPDGQGGNRIADIEELEMVPAHVSEGSTSNEITMYGISTQMLLHVVTDVELDEYLYTRYLWSDKLFKILRQIKSGNEYYSTLLEVNE